MNLLAGKRDPLDFVLLALLAVRKRNKAFLKIWPLSTPVFSREFPVVFSYVMHTYARVCKMTFQRSCSLEFH